MTSSEDEMPGIEYGQPPPTFTEGGMPEENLLEIQNSVNKKLQDEIQELKSELAHYKSKNDENNKLQHGYNKIQKEFEDLNYKSQKLEDENKEMRQNQTRLEGDIAEIKKLHLNQLKKLETENLNKIKHDYDMLQQIGNENREMRQNLEEIKKKHLNQNLIEQNDINNKLKHYYDKLLKEYNDLNRQNQTLENNNKEMRQNQTKLEDDIGVIRKQLLNQLKQNESLINLQNDYDKLQKEYDDLNLKNQNQNKEMRLEDDNNSVQKLQSKIESQQKNFIKYIKYQEKYERDINMLQQSLDIKENEIREIRKLEKEKESDNINLKDQLEKLVQKNALLEDEASNYQSALGVATNFQLRDDDQNHAAKLIDDILDLNDNIKEYITNLKHDVIVDMEEVKKLLSIYKCPTEITNQKNDRLLIQAVLHRHVIETIFSYAKQYFEQSGQHCFLEADIIKSESSLSKLLAYTSICRTGNDEISRVGPMKLRRQIYSILSNRGFADILGDNNTAYEHPFIKLNTEKLNEITNKLRIIKDDEKKSYSEGLAANIIREVIKIFWFRLNVQEPVAEVFWIPHNTKVDQAVMDVNQTRNGNDDDDLCVDLCYFPLIGRDPNTNDRKVYTSAKVITRKSQYNQQQSQPTNYTNLLNGLFSKCKFI